MGSYYPSCYDKDKDSCKIPGFCANCKDYKPMRTKKYIRSKVEDYMQIEKGYVSFRTVTKIMKALYTHPDIETCTSIELNEKIKTEFQNYYE
jgi:hypothetical protein